MEILRVTTICAGRPAARATSPSQEVHAPETGTGRGHAVAPQNRDDHDVLDHEVVHLHGDNPQWSEGLQRQRPLSIRTATSIASTMLSWFATPFQARSNAVPWSTETRRNGSPTVTLTPESPTHRLVASS